MPASCPYRRFMDPVEVVEEPEESVRPTCPGRAVGAARVDRV
jgi:hypothetical protein